MLMLELAGMTQFAACVAYSYDLFSRKGAARVVKLLLALSWAILTAVLVLRWREVGFSRAPWLTSRETLLWSAWALLTVQALAEWKLRARGAGFFCTALAVATCGAVLLGGAVEPVRAISPILRNPCVWLFFPSGAAAYSLFLLAAFFAALGLARSGVRSDRFHCGLAATALLLLCRGLPGLSDSSAAAEPASVLAAGGFSVFLLLSAAGLWLESLDRRLHQERLRRQPQLAAQLGKVPPERNWLSRFLLACFAFSFLATAVALFRARAAIEVGPFVGLAFLCLLAVAALVFFVRRGRRGAIEESWPEQESFNRWSYQASLYAFPWLTIHLVTGSVWAYDAWGSYWSWQPQQAWVGIAWFYLALILHLEHGKISTAVATCAGALLVGVAIAASGAHGFWPAI
jgi:ABC-type transport system involved in cytochrome c biogenesis permease subunit